jgi:glycosyltransferase involved in cell wall biosynthesis
MTLSMARNKPGASHERVAFTSITSNYLPKARVLGHSLKRHNPDVSFVLVLAEPLDATLLRRTDPFDQIIQIDELGIPDFESWLFKHSIVETCTAIKGHALVSLLNESKNDRRVIYLDPDIVVTGSLDELFSSFDDASILITPHGIEPESTLEAIIDNELSHLQFGVYNLGFLGVRNSVDGLKFSRWWQARLHDFCYDDREHGVFTDQRWVDLAPAFFSGVRILREPGYNVATWNLTHRLVTGSVSRGMRVNREPLFFYHFSGFDSGAQEIMLRRYGHKSPALVKFREWYMRECERMGQSELGSLPWAYARFDNGELITAAQRKLYRAREDLQQAFPNPFASEAVDSSYLEWFRHNAPLEVQSASGLGESDYDIIVLAPSGHVVDLDALWQLVARTVNSDSIVVAGADDVGRELDAYAPGFPFQWVEGDGESRFDSHASVMARWLSSSTKEGLIVVALGVDVPELWDLRLHWHASRQPNVISVSPLTDGHQMASPFDAGGRPAGADAPFLDHLISLLELHDPLLTPTFVPSCFYVSRARTREAIERTKRWDLHGDRSGSWARSSLSSVTGFGHMIANDLFVGAPKDSDGLIAHDSFDDSLSSKNGVAAFVSRNALHETHIRLKDLLAQDEVTGPSVVQRASRRQLHVMHAWGGGLERWVRSYCEGDSDHVNMILRPSGPLGEYGSSLALYADIDSLNPVASWTFPMPIKATVPSHLTYDRVAAEIVNTYGIDVVIVSSLIGHSMGIMKTPARTLFLCHDYFPLTPDIYLRSEQLSGNRVTNLSWDDLFSKGPLEFFPNYSRSEARAAHSAFREVLKDRRVTLVAPSTSTRALYLDLAPELDPEDIVVVPHGTARHLLSAPIPEYEAGGRLRIVVPGRVSAEKGKELLATLLPALSETADILLLGCGIEGAYLADLPGLESVPAYDNEDLPRIFERFRPHLGLLASDFPETFSYTLDELLAMAIPPVAVRIGSFSERITDGVTGFLTGNDPEEMLSTVKSLDADRAALAAVRAALERLQPRTVPDMIRDYEAVLQQSRFSRRAFFGTSLPPDAYHRVTPSMQASVGLTSLARPVIRSTDPSLCVVRGDDIALYPSASDLAPTEITFPSVYAEGAASVSAVLSMPDRDGPPVEVAAEVRDSDSGVLVAGVELDVESADRSLDIPLDAFTRRIDVTFRSKLANGSETNDHAHLVVKGPRLTFDQ